MLFFPCCCLLYIFRYFYWDLLVFFRKGIKNCLSPNLCPLGSVPQRHFMNLIKKKKKKVHCWSEEKMENQSTDNKLHWKGYKSFLSVCLYLIFLHFNTKAACNFLWNRPYNWNLVQQLRILSGKMPFLSCVARKHSSLVKSKCQWSWLILPRLSVIPANCEQRGSVFGTWISRSGQQHFVRMSGSL